MLNNFIDKRTSKTKIIGTLVLCFLVAICLVLLLPNSVKKYPILMVFGFVSFALTGVMIILLLIIHGLMTGYRFLKHHPDLLKRSMSSSSNTRSEAIKQIKFIDDPYLKKISTYINKIGIFCFLIWIVFFSVTLCVALITGNDGFIKAIVEKIIP